MAYIVTGGTGFVGSRIVRDLVKEGEQVIAYDSCPGGTFLPDLLSEEEMTHVKIVQGDVTDLANLMYTAKENNVEKIIHEAYILFTGAVANPSLAVRVNCGGTSNVFETARLLGLKKVVWASSIGVFGPPEKYAEEYIPNDAPQYPLSLYGACKSFNENLAGFYFDQYGVDSSAIRYGFLYGAGQARGGSASVTQPLIVNPAIGKPGIVPYGDTTFSWLYVDDAARATVLAAKAARTKTRAFNIGGDARSIKEVADYVRKLLPESDITLQPGKLGGKLGVCSKFEDTPIKEELGYSPKWTIERAVKNMINVTREEYGLSLI